MASVVKPGPRLPAQNHSNQGPRRALAKAEKLPQPDAKDPDRRAGPRKTTDRHSLARKAEFRRSEAGGRYCSHPHAGRKTSLFCSRGKRGRCMRAVWLRSLSQRLPPCREPCIQINFFESDKSNENNIADTTKKPISLKLPVADISYYKYICGPFGPPRPPLAPPTRRHGNSSVGTVSIFSELGRCVCAADGIVGGRDLHGPFDAVICPCSFVVVACM
ncbi:hypothetical protein BDY17DRAFT_122243 [Neohortaea acidophila]|uniref:Uncharacterized protein n=1 Tax=Neohortaea acidophila TaxID=245834 RepID=A0A6A6PY43_9PEZI|nr:uncharacterized protein BDY17DRAFT_122243 [Neohortaea acidophila]KAF2484147.1 hypothetical protein BDY17DRAFT_122243 [Neohortaea acidophila]